MKGILMERQVQNRSLSIYLPPSYHVLSNRYPVIYVHDGESLFHSVVGELEELFCLDIVEEVILVGIEPIDRLSEYTPWFSPSIRSDFPSFNGEGKKYLNFIIESIKPYIDTHFYTKSDYLNTGMMGASLGGLISLYAMDELADYFSKFGFISPSLWYPNMLSYVQESQIDKEKSIFLYVGEEEGKWKKNIQRDMVKNVLIVNELFLEKLPKEKYQFVLGKNADHKKEHFISQFLNGVKWLYSKSKPS
ncbi:alpha/beta hydrolase [Niallia sp. FSL W8-0635]|uniref:alpha/beta hydrolase n=1 Tax=Niallia sp. FSL W8-0635 TaxID=2975337 RepID=UPI0009D2BF71|nr:Predicted hydrolase of the alpha/beta superfamily [Mycobacteroides abscessus subsp. abscessus]HEO8421513.1 alpha/beta hydrolase [Yersinia enterocolitica]